MSSSRVLDAVDRNDGCGQRGLAHGRGRACSTLTNTLTVTFIVALAAGLLRRARAATRLQVFGNITTTTLNTGVDFQGTTVTPRNSLAATLTADMPIVAAAAWARRAQAEDARNVAELAVADTRRQVALATADAYLTILAAPRVVEANARARDTAKAHFDLATELEQRGAGSRLNALRAQQQFSTDEALVATARRALSRAPQTLGALTT